MEDGNQASIRKHRENELLSPKRRMLKCKNNDQVNIENENIISQL
jgi:hypothetical protein